MRKYWHYWQRLRQYAIKKTKLLLTLALPNICQLCREDSTELICNICVARWFKDVPRCLCCAHKREDLPAITESTGNKPFMPNASQHEDLKGEEYICGSCISSPPYFITSHTLCDYSPPQQNLILAFKFAANLALADFFARKMHERFWQKKNAPPVDLLLPIPLSRKSLATRGYNQAWEIAHCLGQLSQTPASAQALLKVNETPKQAKLSMKQRQRNLRSTFTANHDIVANRNVVLVDDVMTSGATLNAAAKALLRAGALSVRNYVVMRTPKV